ncbi:MAG TPA: transaldolase [Bryobacteraceae bacterium]
MFSPQTILQQLPTKIYADGADRAGMIRLNENPLIQGLTTNPTLMKQAGISDYEPFARDILRVIRTKPISFEVFSDEFDEMRRQARKIASWQDNVYVKIPVTNTRSESCCPLISELSHEGVKLNVTAILSLRQVRRVITALDPSTPAVISIFAGRIADTGCDPREIMREARNLVAAYPHFELLWASVREVFNIFEAARCGSHIVTVPHAILSKALKTVGSDAESVSLDTVRMFANDAAAAGFTV